MSDRDKLATPIGDILPESRTIADMEAGHNGSSGNDGNFRDIQDNGDMSQAVNDIRSEMPRFRTPRQTEYLTNNTLIPVAKDVFQFVSLPILIYFIIKILNVAFVKTFLIKYTPEMINTSQFLSLIVEILLVIAFYYLMKKIIEKQIPGLL